MAERRSDRPQLFASYSRHDIETVRRIITAIEAAGVNVWVDFKDLQPGATGKRESRPRWSSPTACLHSCHLRIWRAPSRPPRLDARGGPGGGLIFPLIVEAVPSDLMPEALIMRQWLDLQVPDADIDLAAQTIAEAARVAHRREAGVGDGRPPCRAHHHGVSPRCGGQGRGPANLCLPRAWA